MGGSSRPVRTPGVISAAGDVAPCSIEMLASPARARGEFLRNGLAADPLGHVITRERFHQVGPANDADQLAAPQNWNPLNTMLHQ